MTQSNLVDFNKTHALIDLVDNASRYALQAQGALVALTANSEFIKLNSETKDLVLWAVTDRLEDLENLFNGQEWYSSESGELCEEAHKCASQARQIILAYQDGGIIDTVTPDVFSNALWFVSDRIRDIIKLTDQIDTIRK